MTFFLLCLDLSFLRFALINPFPLEVVIKLMVRVVGKTLAYTTVTFTNSKGQLAARGSHTKLVQSAFPLPNCFSQTLALRKG